MNITFYIPTLNAESTIEKSLKSVKNQTIKPKRIFIVDSGSTDETLDIVRKLNVEILNKKSNNLAHGRNLAISNTKTEYVASIDADVVLEKDWLENIMKNFYDDVAGVGGILIEKNHKRLIDRWRTNHLRQCWGDIKIINPDFLFGSNTVFKTKLLKGINYNETYKTNYEDVDISMRLKKKGHNLVYEANAECFHLKKDNLFSVINSARKWSFYSYPLPDNFFILILRLLILNLHWTLINFIKDLIKLRFLQSIISIFCFFYFEYYDINYYFKN